jgi:ribosomal-protein-alanine acetyltransferase
VALDKFRIRPAKPKDLQPLAELEQIAFDKDAFKPSRIRYLITHACATVIVLEKNKRIIGAAYLLWHKNRSNGRIYNIVVTPKLWGRGFGEILLRECETLCKKRRCQYISLEVRVDNNPAIAFYKKHGFEITGRIPAYYEDGTSGFKMFKSLNGQ